MHIVINCIYSRTVKICTHCTIITTYVLYIVRSLYTGRVATCKLTYHYSSKPYTVKHTTWNQRTGIYLLESIQCSLCVCDACIIVYIYRYPHRTISRNVSHNTVIYKTSDVVYDLEHAACSSAQSPRLKMIQV